MRDGHACRLGWTCGCGAQSRDRPHRRWGARAGSGGAQGRVGSRRAWGSAGRVLPPGRLQPEVRRPPARSGGAGRTEGRRPRGHGGPRERCRAAAWMPPAGGCGAGRYSGPAEQPTAGRVSGREALAERPPCRRPYSAGGGRIAAEHRAAAEPVLGRSARFGMWVGTTLLTRSMRSTSATRSGACAARATLIGEFARCGAVWMAWIRALRGRWAGSAGVRLGRSLLFARRLVARPWRVRLHPR